VVNMIQTTKALSHEGEKIKGMREDVKLSLSKYSFWAGLMVLMLIHSTLFFWHYSPRHFVDNTVPIHVDTTRYFSNMASVAGVGGVHGYDPYQMAGYPAGLWNSMGKKGFELARFLFPGVSLERRFYLTLLLGGFMAPIAFGAWFARFFVSRPAKLLWVSLLLVFWHFETHIAYFWRVGNVFFPAGSLLMAVLLMGCWQLVFGGRIAGRGRALSPGNRSCSLWDFFGALGLGVCGALLFYVHTVLMIPLIVCAVGFSLYVIWRKQWTTRILGRIVLAGIIFSALVLPWLVPLLLTRDISVPAPWPMFTGGIKYLIMDFFSDRIYRQHFDRRFLFQAAIVMGVAGSWFVLTTKSFAGEMRALIAGAGICGMIVYGVPLTGTFGAMQPYRFLIPFLVCLLPPAAIGIHAFGLWWSQLGIRSRIWASLPIVLLLPHLTAYFVDLTARPPVASSSQYAEILSAIGQLPGPGRVLIDDIPLGHLTPYYTGKPIIGGLSTQAFVAHGFAGIDDRGILFGRPTQQWTSEELSRYLDLYAVEYLVLQRKELVLLVQQDAARFASLGSVGSWQIFRYLPYQGYDVKGSAGITATYNEIVVKRGSTNEVILKFHFSPFLRSATPGFEMEAFEMDGVPLAFIRCVFADGVEVGVISH